MAYGDSRDRGVNTSTALPSPRVHRARRPRTPPGTVADLFHSYCCLNLEQRDIFFHPPRRPIHRDFRQPLSPRLPPPRPTRPRRPRPSIRLPSRRLGRPGPRRSSSGPRSRGSGASGPFSFFDLLLLLEVSPRGLLPWRRQWARWTSRHQAPRPGW